MKKSSLKFIVFFVTLHIVTFLFNTSVVCAADTESPTECKVTINSNALYTNNRYVTLDLYGVDDSTMQVWISNDGINGTVVDFAYNTTITITDQNYSVGADFTTSNSSTTTNTDNVLRIVNWPLSSINGVKKVYAVFRDAYGNRTSVNGLTTISVTYDLNGGSGTTPAAATTVKNLGVYTPKAVPSAINEVFIGWSTDPAATIPSFSSYTLASFAESDTLYAVYKTISAGEYIYYPVNRSNSYTVPGDDYVGTSSAQTMKMSSLYASTPAVFRIISANATSVKICPQKVFSLRLDESAGVTNGPTVINSIIGLYAATNYSSSIALITQAQMAAHSGTPGLSTLFSSGAWVSPGSWSGYTAKYATSSGTSNINLSTASTEEEYKNVIPVITLSTSLEIVGDGTSSSKPYSLVIK